MRRWDSLNFLLAIGLACEVVGYIFRTLSNTDDPYRHGVMLACIS